MRGKESGCDRCFEEEFEMLRCQKELILGTWFIYADYKTKFIYIYYIYICYKIK